MFPKTLLSIIGGDQALDTLKRDIALAAAHDCHLAVQVFGIAPPPPTSIYGVIPAEVWTEERGRGNDATNAKAEEAEAVLAAEGISADATAIYCDIGQIAGVAAVRARHADLALVHTGAAMDDHPHREVLKGLLFESARPVLAIPGNSAPTLKPKRVVLAWNSSREASRALQLSLDLLAGCETVRVAMIDPVAGEYGHGAEPGTDIAGYLARHGLDVSVDTLASGGRDVAEVLLRHANDIGADLIVAGAYGHSRLREYLFGGVTHSLLHEARVPVFMAH